MRIKGTTNACDLNTNSHIPDNYLVEIELTLDRLAQQMTAEEVSKLSMLYSMRKPKTKIEKLNPFRSMTPDTFGQVHYAYCKMADKIDELISAVNTLMEKEG